MGTPTELYRKYAIEAAKKYGLNPQILLNQIQAESGFNPNAGSSAGAQGIAQIMPATAKAWGVNPHDPFASINAMAKHMAGYVKQYHGSYPLALSAYNAGPGAVAKAGNKVPNIPETQNYVQKILHGKNAPKGATGPLGAVSNLADSVSDDVTSAVTAPVKGIEAVGDAMGVIAHLFTELFDPTFWLRVGKVILGAFIIAVCLWRLTAGSSGGMPIPIPV